jgi:hypothetical protein
MSRLTFGHARSCQCSQGPYAKISSESS